MNDVCHKFSGFRKLFRQRGFTRNVRLLLCLLLLFVFRSSLAYEIDGTKWIGGKTNFYIGLDGVSLSNISWSLALRGALEDWSDQTNFVFGIVDEYKDPCLVDMLNSTDFTDDVCGSEFGENVLAVTLISYESQELGPPAIIESDIVVNKNRAFDVFTGSQGLSKAGTLVIDYGRVMLHELGHVIGLGHEETKEAIMAPTISDIDRLQEDDIAGVNRLYSGLSNCRIQPISFGITSGELGLGDCTVSEMTVGGSDDSFIDLYRIVVHEGPTNFEFSVKSSNLDSVLLLATADLEYLSVDSLSTLDCNSFLSRTLDSGSYILMVNTYDRQIKEACSTTGSYNLSTAFTQSFSPVLWGNASLLGSVSEAEFRGGVSSNNNESYGNLFQPSDSLEISAHITLDESHVGRPGFILVAAILADQFLMLNRNNEFVDTGFNPSPFVKHKQKTLEAEEEIVIAENLVPSDLGIEEIEVNFVVGYGLDVNPGEVFYHITPINLIVKPTGSVSP